MTRPADPGVVRLRCTEFPDGLAEIRFEIRGVVFRRPVADAEEGLMLCMEVQHALECLGVEFTPNAPEAP